MVVGLANILSHRLPVSVQRAARGVPGGEEMRKNLGEEAYHTYASTLVQGVHDCSGRAGHSSGIRVAFCMLK